MAPRQVPTASATKGDPSQSLGPAGNAVPSLAVLFRPNARLRHEGSVLSLRYRFPASSPSRVRTAAVIGGLAASLHRSRLQGGPTMQVRSTKHPSSIHQPPSMPFLHPIPSHPSSSPLDFALDGYPLLKRRQNGVFPDWPRLEYSRVSSLDNRPALDLPPLLPFLSPLYR